MSSASVRREGICEVGIDGELVLLDTSTGTLHLLNRVAAAVWSELDGTHDVESIVERLSHASDANADRVREDVTALLDQLRSCDLVA
jgi:hypothetical protein